MFRMAYAAVLFGLLSVPAFSQEPYPFGEDQQFYWVCEATLERGHSELSGTWTVDAHSSQQGFVNWKYTKPIVVDDYSSKSEIELTGFWISMQGPDPFRAGSINFQWRAPRRIPRHMTLSFGGKWQSGEFTALMRKSEKRLGFATLSLRPLLLWTGDEAALGFSIYNEKRSKFLGSGQISTDVFRGLEADFDQLRVKLQTKAEKFQSQCKRIEYDQNVIII